MNVSINNAKYERGGLEMIERPESHCLKYLDRKLREMEQEELGMRVDAEEIRKLTKGQHRADWEEPREGMSTHDIACAYMAEWGSLEHHELEKFGVWPLMIAHTAKKCGWKIHTKNSRNGAMVHYTEGE